MTKFSTLSRSTLACVGAPALLIAGPLAAGEGKADSAAGIKLSATLTGAVEVPGPGDTDGSGTFSAHLNTAKGELCYTLGAAAIATASAAHIHTGAAGVAGPVAAPLSTPGDGSTKTCITLATELAQAIARVPADYYVNVHNAEFPNGAIRGQLGH